MLISWEVENMSVVLPTHIRTNLHLWLPFHASWMQFWAEVPLGRLSRALALQCLIPGRIHGLICQAGALGPEDCDVEEREPLTFPCAACWHRLGCLCQRISLHRCVLCKWALLWCKVCSWNGAAVRLLPSSLCSAYLYLAQFSNLIHHFESHTWFRNFKRTRGNFVFLKELCPTYSCPPLSSPEPAGCHIPTDHICIL